MDLRVGLAQSDDIFEVERILKKRRHASKGILYYVKWKNFPSSANTWEPACNFSLDLIRDFEIKQRRKSKYSKPNSSKPVYASHQTTTGTAAATDTVTTSNSCGHTSSLAEQSVATADLASLSSGSTLSVSGSSSATRSPEPLESPFQQHVALAPQPKPRRPRKNSNLNRQQQLQLQMHIEQRQKGLQAGSGQQFAIFNPVTCHLSSTLDQSVDSQRHKLTKEPIVVTDVVTQDFSVTISECSTPEGFFRSAS